MVPKTAGSNDRGGNGRGGSSGGRGGNARGGDKKPAQRSGSTDKKPEHGTGEHKRPASNRQRTRTRRSSDS